LRMGREKRAIGWSERAVMREMGRDDDEITKIFEERAEEAEARIRAFNSGDLAFMTGRGE
jgi:hypothetical protein